MKTLTLLTLLLTAALNAAPVTLEWTDNSDNEDGFIMRGRLPSGEWEGVGKTLSNVNSLTVDSDAHDAWQVFAFNQWGESGGTNILERGAKPDAPGALQLKSKPSVTLNDEIKSYRKYVQRELGQG